MSYQTVGVSGFTSKNKMPEYARKYKREYQFIRGINKDFKYLINKLDNLNNGLFESNISNRIKYNMKRFLRAQEKGKLKDISEFEIEYDIVFNLIKIKNELNNIDHYLDFILNCYHKEDLIILILVSLIFIIILIYFLQN